MAEENAAPAAPQEPAEPDSPYKNWPGIVNILLCNGSRKVAFAFQLSWAATAFFGFGRISSEQWLFTTMVCGGVVAGGTFMDKKHDLAMAKLETEAPKA